MLKNSSVIVDQWTKSVSNYKISASTEVEKWIEVQTEGRNNVGSLVRRLEFTNEEMTEIRNPVKLDDAVFSSIERIVEKHRNCMRQQKHC